MTLQEAIEARHSVRAYKEQPLAKDVVKVLEEQIELLNREGKLHIQLILNEPKAFQGTMAKYGKFRGRMYLMKVRRLHVTLLLAMARHKESAIRLRLSNK